MTPPVTSVVVPDRTLLARMARGDIAALSYLHRRYETTAYALAYGILFNAARADEVVEKSFDEVWWLATWLRDRRYQVRDWLMAHVRDLALTKRAQRRD